MCSQPCTDSFTNELEREVAALEARMARLELRLGPENPLADLAWQQPPALPSLRCQVLGPSKVPPRCATTWFTTAERSSGINRAQGR